MCSTPSIPLQSYCAFGSVKSVRISFQEFLVASVSVAIGDASGDGESEDSNNGEGDTWFEFTIGACPSIHGIPCHYLFKSEFLSSSDKFSKVLGTSSSVRPTRGMTVFVDGKDNNVSGEDGDTGGGRSM
ncbi:hypothetical protein CTI12_AA523120 [Artemisia annua]|uniref:Uncharacterized protein n=1 Tax=Artemisia annua TaxID=35608 RepID=A0A2U1L722_ARTAN|nr:hypothetical protein CTI12_AA523120 [Artemisia annua]